MLKRIFDLGLSFILLVLLAPVMLALALLVLLIMGNPVFFRQQRPGLGGKPFYLIKFRTMRQAEAGESKLNTDEQRLSPFGARLRKYSLDELPQLINVLKGELCFVGPRPLLMQYLERYTPEQARRHEVKPGITGWAQVNGRNAISWEEKFALDVWYVDNRSFWLDLKIMWLTLLKVLSAEGISGGDSATMSEFLGSNQGEEPDQTRGTIPPVNYQRMESDQLMVKEFVILGAGGFGREASLLVEQINESANSAGLKLRGFIDGDESKWGQVMRSYPVLGGWDYLSQLSAEVAVICVVGDPVNKKRMVARATECGRKFINLLDPALALGSEVSIGDGVLINSGCLFTTNISFGNHVSINPGCGIGHDVVIGDYTTLMWRVNISGNVPIGEGCLIGTGATILQGLTIGSGVTVGAGAVVTKDLPDGCTAVGVPARVIKQN